MKALEQDIQDYIHIDLHRSWFDASLAYRETFLCGGDNGRERRIGGTASWARAKTTGMLFDWWGCRESIDGRR